jgi:DNA-binding LytR/AlgR family response regulator
VQPHFIGTLRAWSAPAALDRIGRAPLAGSSVSRYCPSCNMYVHPFAERAADDAARELEFAAAGPTEWLARIAVRSINRIVIVPVGEIVRLEAEDNYVRIWAERPYLHKETLTGLMQRLDPAAFLRIHRSHAVNIALVRELRPQLHGEYVVALADRTELTSGRSYRSRIQRAFGLTRLEP